MQKIIIIGATSGIGLHLARLYAAAGHLVGATGRRQDLLYALQLEHPNQVVTECYDATGSQATAHLDSLVQKLGGLDLLIYNAGWGEPMEALDAAVDKATVDVNVNAFLAAIHYGWRYFTAQGHGHLSRCPPSPATAVTGILLLTAQPKLFKALTSKGSISRQGK